MNTAASIFTEIHRDGLHSTLRNPQASFAFACWQMAKVKAELPEEPDLVGQLSALLKPDMMILRLQDDHDLLYEHYGSNIAAHAGFDMTGKRVSDFGGALKAFYTNIYAEVIAERRPMATLHRLGHFRERPLWERVILPVAVNGCVSALYVVNTVRELEFDVNHLKVRSGGNGLIVLQFERNADGGVTDALIVGANKAAVSITGQRLDQLLDKSMAACFPNIYEAGLWTRYIEVSDSRVPQEFPLTYVQDGFEGEFQVIIAPFLDGVSVEFSRTT